ncbi:MAG: hypothetical protein Q9O62_11440 [Ardenticatenia bacterium]|nr:hypothetical protein [Ardenticatenia bacterium]
MEFISWKRLIALGFVLALIGAVLPFLMVIKLLPASFFLSFLAYGSSVAGLWFGMMGAVQAYLERRH